MNSHFVILHDLSACRFTDDEDRSHPRAMRMLVSSRQAAEGEVALAPERLLPQAGSDWACMLLPFVCAGYAV